MLFWSPFGRAIHTSYFLIHHFLIRQQPIFFSFSVGLKPSFVFDNYIIFFFLSVAIKHESEPSWSRLLVTKDWYGDDIHLSANIFLKMCWAVRRKPPNILGASGRPYLWSCKWGEIVLLSFVVSVWYSDAHILWGV